MYLICIYNGIYNTETYFHDTLNLYELFPTSLHACSGGFRELSGSPTYFHLAEMLNIIYCVSESQLIGIFHICYWVH